MSEEPDMSEEPEVPKTAKAVARYTQIIEAVFHRYWKKGKAEFASVGMDILLDGTVPAGGGLSSSAAFVCASALAVMRANGEEKVDQTELTEVAIVSERAVGVNSGG